MNKKGVFALLGLLVFIVLMAAISGSFAYFSAVATSSSKTNISVNSPNVGLVGMTGNTNLSLNVTASMMTSANQGKYYAQSGSTAPVKNTVATHNVATIALAGGASNLTYTCKGTVTISLPADNNTIKTVLTQGSLFAGLSGDTGITFTQNDITTIDLYNAKTTNIVKNFTVTLTPTAATKYIKSSVYFENTSANQNTLAGKTLKVNIASALTECSVATTK